MYRGKPLRVHNRCQVRHIELAYLFQSLQRLDLDLFHEVITQMTDGWRAFSVDDMVAIMDSLKPWVDWGEIYEI